MSTIIPLITSTFATILLAWLLNVSDSASILAIVTIAVAAHLATWETLRTSTVRKE